MIPFSNTKTALTAILYLIVGGGASIVTGIYLFLSIPIFIYRLFVTKVIVPMWVPKLGNPICVAGQSCATDFTARYLHSSYRASVVVNHFFKGIIPMNDLQDRIQCGWVDMADERGNLVYPEIKQYICQFMGFMYWKHDKHFQLTNHLRFHDIGHNATDALSEKYMCKLTEKLMNQSFKKRKSPWELHLVHNYRNSSMCDDTMSVVVLWTHHCVGDATSLVPLLSEVVFDKKFEDMSTVFPKHTNVPILSLRNIIYVIPNLIRMTYDAGYLVKLLFQRGETPWLLQDRNKSSRIFYSRSKLFRVNYIKGIKNKFRVSFTAVILSCISAAIGSSFKHNDEGMPATIPVTIPLPRWKSKRQVGISSTAIMVEIPISCAMDPVKRLLACQEVIDSAKQSRIPQIMTILMTIFQSNLTLVNRFISRNRICPVFLSILPAPEDDAYWNGENQFVGYDFSGGTQLGNAGAAFLISSYKNDLRIAVNVEGAIMNKDSLEAMLSTMEGELEILNSTNSKFVQNV